MRRLCAMPIPHARTTVAACGPPSNLITSSFLPSFLPGRFALTRVRVCARVLRAGTALYELSPRHVVRTARRAPGIYIYIYQRTLAHPQALRRTPQSLELYIFICVRWEMPKNHVHTVHECTHYITKAHYSKSPDLCACVRGLIREGEYSARTAGSDALQCSKRGCVRGSSSMRSGRVTDG